ncbi:MAG TPA: endonuclease/exonuclease/phosphatase family protein [Marinilabiliaceae bacterium]|nr:endonuclease/exonuclease/phosphatase family protein [Marinilabiliaceae bacterium]
MKKLFSSIQFVVVLVLALLLLGAMATSYIEPIHIHILAFSGFFFPLFWLTNAIAFLWLLLRRRWLVLIPLVAILITWNSWDSVFQIKGVPANPETIVQPLKILSYNTRLFDYYEHSGLEGAPDAVFEAILNENPDVICFQEYYTTLRNKKYTPNAILARFRNYKYRHIEYLRTRKGNTGYGLATFSKYPITHTGVIRFEKSNNLSIFSDITIDNKQLRIFNNHLESVGFKDHELSVLDSLDFRMTRSQKDGLINISDKLNRAFSLRSKQAEAIAQHVENSPYPVIVCGDFNDTPVSYTYRLMKRDLKDAFRQSGFGFGGTYNGKLPSFRIDYIFHAPEFTSSGYKKLNIKYSDHFPIMTTIDLGE